MKKSKLKEKRQKFIIKTLKPYIEDKSNCGYDEEQDECLYLTPDGKKCAVGRWMREGGWQEFEGSYSELLDEGYNPKDLLKKKALKVKFGIGDWDTIQDVHDALAVEIPTPVILDRIDDLERCTGTNLDELKKLLINKKIIQ